MRRTSSVYLTSNRHPQAPTFKDTKVNETLTPEPELHPYNAPNIPPSCTIPVIEKNKDSTTHIPPIANTLLSTYGNVLCIAPRSDEWASTKPENVHFLSNPTQKEIIDQIRSDKPLAIVVGDQVVDEEMIRAWREVCPTEKLMLLRRGASLDKIRMDVCNDNNIQVMNTPGVNAPHVAHYMVEQLKMQNGELPKKIRLLGCGDVGKEVIKKVLGANSDTKIEILVRNNKTLTDLGLEQHADRLSTITSWENAFKDADAVAICVSINSETTNRIGKQHIDGMQENAHIVCVSKPDVFSNDALKALSQKENIALTIDYGTATLNAFRNRATELEIPIEQWKNPAQLTTKAATTKACKQDLDYAVAVRLAIAAQNQLVREKLQTSFKIPVGSVPAGARTASVIGRGINGLVQALMLRILGIDVTVYGDNTQADGPSHNGMDERHFSATETMAKKVHNPYLLAGNNDLIINTNRSGIELFEKLLEDNPELQRYVKKNVVRAYPYGEGDADKSIAFQRRISQQDWPSGKQGCDVKEFTGEEFQNTYCIPGIAKAIELPGYDLEFKKFMDRLIELLEAAGVKFVKLRLTLDEISKLSENQPVVTAMGAEGRGVIPVAGWFMKLRSVGNEGKNNEGENIRGIKFQYELPIGVMNCRGDGDYILISGGQVPPGSSEEETGQIKEKYLQAAGNHFPQSYEYAKKTQLIDLIQCVRPGTEDGLSIVGKIKPNLIEADATNAAGTTQALILGAIVQDVVGG